MWCQTAAKKWVSEAMTSAQSTSGQTEVTGSVGLGDLIAKTSEKEKK
jgi:hypothetical protein